MSTSSLFTEFKQYFLSICTRSSIKIDLHSNLRIFVSNHELDVYACVSRGHIFTIFRQTNSQTETQFIHANHPLRCVFINFILVVGYMKYKQPQQPKMILNRKPASLISHWVNGKDESKVYTRNTGSLLSINTILAAFQKLCLRCFFSRFGFIFWFSAQLSTKFMFTCRIVNFLACRRIFCGE